jgi:integrase
MTPRLLAMPHCDWPDLDRQLWASAVTSGNHALRELGIPTHFRTSWQGLRWTYGRWLRWLEEAGALHVSEPPVSRMTPARLQAFFEGEMPRIAPVTLAHQISNLLAVALLLAPSAELLWLKQLAISARRRARAQRPATTTPCLAEDLYRLGLDLVDAAREDLAQGSGQEAFRDGVMIALLAAMPVRIGQYAQLDVVAHLQGDRGVTTIAWPAELTKTRRSDTWTLPPELGEILGTYLDQVRPSLLARMPRQAPVPTACWIGNSGRPIGPQVLRKIIRARAMLGLKTKVRPHDFRRAAATTYVLSFPARAIEASAVLGHADTRTTERHYIAGQKILAHRQYLTALRRRDANARRQQHPHTADDDDEPF